MKGKGESREREREREIITPQIAPRKLAAGKEICPNVGGKSLWIFARFGECRKKFKVK
jgi:hypothetical protein